ncbi:MAG: cytochrome b/b6 domain-containing protein [Actinomycetota bacterium]
MHATLYLTTGFLFLSGVAVFAEGQHWIAAVFGGHVGAAVSHRWVGFLLIAAAGVIVVANPRSARRFLRDSFHFRRSDVWWFRSYPGFVLHPTRNTLPNHNNHFDPGQRVFNIVVVISLLVLAVTGLFMAFPQQFAPGVYAFNIRLHQIATVVLLLSVIGHLVVATGLLPAYRGVWRAMHGNGEVPVRLAEILWPGWTDRKAPERRFDSRKDRA